MDEIRAISWEARRWAERKAKKLHYSSDLAGMCAFASVHLFKLLRRAKFRPVLVENKDHCHVRVSPSKTKGSRAKRKIVDITATQFGTEFKRVEIRPASDASTKAGRIWKGRILRSPTALRRRWGTGCVDLEG